MSFFWTRQSFSLRLEREGIQSSSSVKHPELWPKTQRTLEKSGQNNTVVYSYPVSVMRKRSCRNQGSKALNWPCSVISSWAKTCWAWVHGVSHRFLWAIAPYFYFLSPNVLFQSGLVLLSDPSLLLQMRIYHTHPVRPTLFNHFGIQNQNPVDALIWKNRITLPGNKRSQNASLFFCTCIALTKRDDRLWACTRCTCTPTCPHIPTHSSLTHTHTHTHTVCFSPFTLNSDMSHCWGGGGYCLGFGFCGFKDRNTFFFLL